MTAVYRKWASISRAATLTFCCFIYYVIRRQQQQQRQRPLRVLEGDGKVRNIWFISFEQHSTQWIIIKQANAQHLRSTVCRECGLWLNRKTTATTTTTTRRECLVRLQFHYYLNLHFILINRQWNSSSSRAIFLLCASSSPHPSSCPYLIKVF